MPTRLLSATVLTFVVLVAGCSDSDDSGSGAPSPTPSVEATTPAEPTTTSAVKADGAAIFTDAGCAACHTLAAAGAKGVTGPNLDDRRPDADEARDQVASGGGGMPGYDGRLSADEIDAVAEFIADNAGQ